MKGRIIVEKQRAAQWEISNPEGRKVDISGNVDIGGLAIGQNGRSVTHSSRSRRREIPDPFGNTQGRQVRDDEWVWLGRKRLIVGSPLAVGDRLVDPESPAQARRLRMTSGWVAGMGPAVKTLRSEIPDHAPIASWLTGVTGLESGVASGLC